MGFLPALFKNAAYANSAISPLPNNYAGYTVTVFEVGNAIQRSCFYFFLSLFCFGFLVSLPRFLLSDLAMFGSFL
jgi:hypothetical protein